MWVSGQGQFGNPNSKSSLSYRGNRKVTWSKMHLSPQYKLILTVPISSPSIILILPTVHRGCHSGLSNTFCYLKPCYEKCLYKWDVLLLPETFSMFAVLFVWVIYLLLSTVCGPPLCSSGQSSWLQIQRSGFDSRRYQIFWEVVGLERGPLSLMNTIEELLEGKSSGSGLENRDYGRRGSAALTTRYPSIWKSWH
jgi:hypothetical protein